MADVRGYSYEHQFPLDETFPQADPLSEKVTTANTDHIDHNSDQYISQKLR